jgi:hypothetical protein
MRASNSSFAGLRSKNFSDPVGALKEMYRVLFAERRPASGIAQLKSLRNRAYTADQFREFFSHTGFGAAEIQESLTGFAIRFQKR